MTHSTDNIERENRGSLDVAFHRINVTSLDGDGEEIYDASAETGIEGKDRFGVGIRGQENNTVAWGYNTTTGNLTVRQRSDNSAISEGNDVGTVTLEVTGQ